ncbi:MAG: hypothetical protein ACKOXF_05520, partial [Chitinophagaceae bacterium]
MKQKLCLAIAMLLVLNLSAQDANRFPSSKKSYKYQVSTNLFLSPTHTYTGGFHLNLETISKKTNYGIGFTNYSVSSSISNRYYTKDSIIYKDVSSNQRWSSGLTFNINRSLTLNQYKHRLVYGIQLYTGFNRIRTIRHTEYYDTVYLHNANNNILWDYGWRSLNKSLEVEQTGMKLSFGGALVVRLELNVSKRLTFSPGLLVPFIAHNESGGRSFNVDPGFNFHLGYRFIEGIKAHCKL